MESKWIWFDRVPLVAGVKTPIFPYRGAWRVLIGAESTGVLEVHSTDDNDAHFVRIAAGWERTFDLRRGVMETQTPAFWLKAAGNGEAVLAWA